MTTFRWAFSAMVCLLLTACASLQAGPSPEARAALAPTGKLRVGLYSGNPLSVVRDPATQQMKGVAFDLGNAMARRLAVPFEPVVYPSVGAMLDGMKSGQWDVTFIVYSSARENEFDFAPAHLESELGYLVPKDSRIATIGDVDRPGVTIAVPAKGQGDVILTSSIKQAALVRSAGLGAGLELVKSGKADAFAAIKPSLFELSAQLPGSRVLDGRFASERVAMAIPKGRAAGVAYARMFVEEAKADGTVKAAIERSGARGVVVAPPVR